MTSTMAVYDDPVAHHLQVVFARKMKERKIFMEELKEIRTYTGRRVYKIIKKSIGPKWYQVLSSSQIKALDSLDFCVYQDLLEGRPVRTTKILRILGIYPIPNRLELLNCMYVGRHDAKEVLGNVFLNIYGHKFGEKLLEYDLNGRILLSSIFYLALPSLIELLKEKFKPEPPSPPPPKKPKPKSGPRLKSPYLQDMVAPMYEPKPAKKRPVFPLPNLESLDEPYDETPPVPRPPPPPPPPPPPKKRLPVSYCDQIAGYKKYDPIRRPPPPVVKKAPCLTKKVRASKLCLAESTKKVYGLGESIKPAKKIRKKPRIPSTGFENAQFFIQGVYFYNGRPYFILGGVSITSQGGYVIHGGHRLLNGEYLMIHNGYRAEPPIDDILPCDCVKVYQDKVFKYIEKNKCHCGHYYDYGHEEGTYQTDEQPFFEKPNRRSGFQFNYATIFETNPRIITVQKEFQKLWETESFLHETEDPEDIDPEKERKKKKKVVRKSSKTCLGIKPTIKDYLRCALRCLRRTNMAARLPDLHLAPELIEWMRHRLYGSFTKEQKKSMEVRSTTYWTYLKSFQNVGLGKASVPFVSEFQKMNTWKNKAELADKFRHFVLEYKHKIYKAHAFFNNLLWATMCQAQMPDKRFREIYFSYMVSKMTDIHLMHPYNQVEVGDRTVRLAKKRMHCLPEYIPDTLFKED